MNWLFLSICDLSIIKIPEYLKNLHGESGFVTVQRFAATTGSDNLRQKTDIAFFRGA